MCIRNEICECILFKELNWFESESLLVKAEKANGASRGEPNYEIFTVVSSLGVADFFADEGKALL